MPDIKDIEIEFRNEVLGWHLSHLDKRKQDHPEFLMQGLNALPSTFWGMSHYHSSFKDLILYEALSILRDGLEGIGYHRYPAERQRAIGDLTLSINQLKTYPHSNDVEIKCYQRGNSRLKEPLRTHDAFLLVGPNDTVFWGLVTYNDEGSPHFTFKTKLSKTKHATLQQYREGNWYAFHLGNMTTISRMYTACRLEPTVAFQHQLLLGNAEHQVRRQMPTAYTKPLENLNAPQREAVRDFLKLQQGLSIIEGPPGTGKTTTIISLLDMLNHRKSRTMVSAPSNKAVQLLLLGFRERCPDAYVIYIGVIDKLPPELKDVCIHTWVDFRTAQICAFITALQKIQASLEPKSSVDVTTLTESVKKLNINDDKSSVEKAQEIIARLTKISNDLNLYLPDQITEYKGILDALLKNLESTKVLLARNSRRAPEFILAIIDQLTQLNAKLTTNTEKIEEELQKRALFIFSTLSVAGRSALQAIGTVRNLIIDEAAQSTEAETKIPFVFQPDRCLLVGDTRQLPATVKSSNAKETGFGRSLMSRLVDDCKHSHHMLTIQHRMHAQIRAFPSLQFYGNRLQDAAEVTARQLEPLPSQPLFHRPYSIIDVASGHDEHHESSPSYRNTDEAQWALTLVKQLKKTYSNAELLKRVGIITFYADQVLAISQKLNPLGLASLVHTVDGFQGGEKDIIIISCVRTKPGRIGFLSDYRRLNVAITRAKMCLVILMNVQKLRQCDDTNLQALIANGIQRKIVVSEESAENLLELATSFTPDNGKGKQKDIVEAASSASSSRSHQKQEAPSPATTRKLCVYYQRGHCKYEASCRDRHDDHQAGSSSAMATQASSSASAKSVPTNQFARRR